MGCTGECRVVGMVVEVIGWLGTSRPNATERVVVARRSCWRQFVWVLGGWGGPRDGVYRWVSCRGDSG
jgi:hypothetical protein